MSPEQRIQKLFRIPVPFSKQAAQAGGGMLAIVATLGAVLMVVQGTVYYKSNGSAKFMGAERNKILAQQLAEAGVEENIADLGKRIVKVPHGQADTVTYDRKPMGGGTFTTKFSTVATGAASDTIDLISSGTMGQGTETVRARMKLKKILDTTRTPLVIVKPDTLLTFKVRTVADTDTAVTVQDPNAMAALDKTPAYNACMSSAAKKCDICHLPGGDYTKRNVINVAKSAIGTHISHHGDYVTTDGTCDLYKPKNVFTITYHSFTDTTRTIVSHTTYDTTIVIDTSVRVQILSWK
jgi:hypothetical protein